MIALNILRQIPLFSELSDEQFEFAKLGRERWIESGEIWRLRENHRDASVLLDGEIQCTKKVGDRQVLWLIFGPASDRN